jgi:PPOX class probable F420-dependent enzyme
MPRMKPDVLDDLLARPIVAVIATLRRDGRPYQVPVWFLWHPDDPAAPPAARVGPDFRPGTFWLTGTYTRTWCKHIFKDPRVSLCIETSDPVARFAAVDCLATPVEPQDADIWPISAELARKYVGSRGRDPEAFVANMKTEPRLLFRLTPTHWRAIDLTVYRGSRGDVAYQQARRGSE